jgi:hypothetical protein
MHTFITNTFKNLPKEVIKFILTCQKYIKIVTTSYARTQNYNPVVILANSNLLTGNPLIVY